MRKKGQAAMEFLMTYGWAILVVLVVIGALAYFGVINPTMFLPDKCLIGTGLQCEQHLITEGGNAIFQVRNSLGEKITITEFSVYDTADEDGSPSCSASETIITNGDSKQITATCTSLEGVAGEKLRYGLVVKYYKGTDATFSHTFEGEVLTTVEAAASP